MDELLKKLNKDQYDAVVSNSQYIRVIAGAGSGKTRVLATRIAYLIDNIGAVSKRILAITFTNKAANEMRKRVEEYLKIDNCAAHISTYHSFCARFLREEAYQVGYPRNFTIIDEEDQERIIKKIIKTYDEKITLTPKNIRNYISAQKNRGLAPMVNEQLSPYNAYRLKAEIYEAYQNQLLDNHYFDFDDLLIYTVHILRTDEKTRKKWQERFDYILIDEFQDTNDIQYELLKLLCNKLTSVFVVGDPDQTIYTWRGADINIIMDFPKDFKKTFDYVLKENYRSTTTILDCANALISHNKNRVPKDLVAFKGGHDRILCYGADSIDSEGNWICQCIEDIRKRDETVNYRDFAILYRSNYYSGGLEKSLINKNIPYNIYGGVKFFARKEIKDAICHLRLLISDDDYVALERIINEPRRGIGPKTIDGLYSEASKEEKPIVRYLLDRFTISKESGKLADFIKIIAEFRDRILDPNHHENYGSFLMDLLDKVGYTQMLLDDKEDGEDRLDNIKELSTYLFNAQRINPDVTLYEIMQEVTLYTSQDEIVDKDAVTLMTVHTAKGLEYPYVFVAGMAEAVFPNARSITEVDEDEPMLHYKNNDKLEEERRLAYVAFTRAMDRLYLSFNQSYNYATGDSGRPSRFITEIDRKITRYRPANTERSYPYRRPIFPTRVSNEARSTLSANPTDYRPGEVVIHNTFGEGIVIEVTDSSLRIAFKDIDIGVKTISRKFTGIKKKGA